MPLVVSVLSSSSNYCRFTGLHLKDSACFKWLFKNKNIDKRSIRQLAFEGYLIGMGVCTVCRLGVVYLMDSMYWRRHLRLTVRVAPWKWEEVITHFVLSELRCHQAIFQCFPVMSISVSSITGRKAGVTFNVVQQKTILKGSAGYWSWVQYREPLQPCEILFMLVSWLNSFAYQWMDQVKEGERFVLVINSSLA